MHLLYHALSVLFLLIRKKNSGLTLCYIVLSFCLCHQHPVSEYQSILHNAPEKEVEDDTSTCALAVYVGDLDGAPRSRLQSGRALAIVAIQEVNQWMVSLCISLSHSVSDK